MSLELIIGPMFAGKSSAILRMYNRYKSIGYNILILSHSSDNRYSEEQQIVNHDGSKIPCYKISDFSDVLNWEQFKVAQLIIIEEAQFFKNLVHFTLKAVEDHQKNVVIVGLDGDAERRPFGEILDLVPYSDTITKLKAFCSDCNNGTEALFTYCKRPDEKKEQVCVGGGDMYMPLCRKHYVGRTQCD